MVVRGGTNHHSEVLDYLEGEKLCCGNVVSFNTEWEGRGRTRETQ